MNKRALAFGAFLGFAVAVVPSCSPTPGPAVQCSKDTCATGCCDDQGTCQTAGEDTACGTGGVSCEACAMGKTCSMGVCRLGGNDGGGGSGGVGGTGGSGGDAGTDAGLGCNAGNCAGCCNTDDVCVPPSFTGPSSCGKNGGACNPCFAGQACVNGICDVPPTCNNACRNASGSCVAGSGATNNSFCGNDGGICRSCKTDAGESCVAGACKSSAVCNSTTCANGCCEPGSNKCLTLPPSPNAQCGKNGVACFACGSNDQCNGASCGPKPLPDGGTNDGGFVIPGLDGGLLTCNAANCPNGCCVTLSGIGLCQPGDDSLLGCGTGGKSCEICFLKLKTCSAQQTCK